MYLLAKLYPERIVIHSVNNTGEASLTMEESLDYHPFASKAEALMYIMNNGIRSVVSCCTFQTDTILYCQ